MKFGIFYEHQLPRPWREGGEHALFKDALDQIELADRLGFDCVWEVEHHFLEEYSHSSAPEVFLAAASQRTKNARLVHGIVQMPPKQNHPARVAERIATLDLVSNGRVEFGTGEGATVTEIEGFGTRREEKKAAWEEATRECLRMMTMKPYPGYEGEFFSMPERNIVPKPLQQTDDLGLDADVERRHRLVEHDQLGLQCQRAGDADALALAAGELVRVPVGSDRAELHEVEQLVDALFAL